MASAVVVTQDLGTALAGSSKAGTPQRRLEESHMPRIIVTTDLSPVPDGAEVLLDEEVYSVHLSTGHAGRQLLERLAWAIADAEAFERGRPQRPARPPHRASRRPMHTTTGVRLPIGA